MSDLSAASVRTLHARKESDLSNDYLTAVWALTLGNSSDKLVLAALADYANEHGSCFPGIEAISKRTELSERAIFRSIARLKAKGYVRVIHRHRHSNRYVLQMEVIHKGAPVAPQTDSEVTQGQLLPALVAVRPDPVAARTLKESSLEPLIRAQRPVDNSGEAKESGIRSRYSDTGEIQDLERWATDLGFRPIDRLESPAQYRAALKEFEQLSSTKVLDLQAAIENRRKQQ